MFAVPAASPVTMPVLDPTVAIAVLPLAHVSPPLLVNVVAEFKQILVVPPIAKGTGLTIIVVCAPVSDVAAPHGEAPIHDNLQ